MERGVHVQSERVETIRGRSSLSSIREKGSGKRVALLLSRESPPPKGVLCIRELLSPAERGKVPLSSLTLMAFAKKVSRRSAVEEEDFGVGGRSRRRGSLR